MSVKENIKDVIRTIIGEVPTRKLIKRGLKVGDNFNRQQGCFIDPTHCFLITIGNNVTFSIRVCLMAHDASTKMITGYTKIGKIVIGNNVFVGANTTILPNVVIGDNVIIGANSVVTKNIPNDVVVAGNPARIICDVKSYQKKSQQILEKQNKIFGENYRFSKQLDENKKNELINAVQDGMAYID